MLKFFGYNEQIINLSHRNFRSEKPNITLRGLDFKEKDGRKGMLG